MRCVHPEETAAFMETVEKPWIAFQLMAAGAIPASLAFPYVFRYGGGFILAGMLDFQIEGDAKIAVEAVRKAATRKRPWRG